MIHCARAPRDRGRRSQSTLVQLRLDGKRGCTFSGQGEGLAAHTSDGVRTDGAMPRGTNDARLRHACPAVARFFFCSRASMQASVPSTAGPSASPYRANRRSPTDLEDDSDAVPSRNHTIRVWGQSRCARSRRQVRRAGKRFERSVHIREGRDHRRGKGGVGCW
jgi:hypothetical protein